MPGPILLPEGGSDTAVCLTLDVVAIGRPSNTGGVELLITALGDVERDREIIVVGEQDQKPNGQWPGLDGATRTAHRLAEGLERPIAWALCPTGYKDLRDWFRSHREVATAKQLLESFELVVVLPPPIEEASGPTAATTTLDQDELDYIREQAEAGCSIVPH